MTTDQQSQRQCAGALRTAISDGLVALLNELYGVGPPTQAKTYYFDDDDVVVCLMRSGFTRV